MAAAGGASTSAASCTPKEFTVALVGGHQAGKSTLLGHLGVQTGAIDRRTAIRVDKEAGGRPELKFAWLLDGRAERDKQATNDLKTLLVQSSNGHRYSMIDSPGDTSYFANTAAAVALADVAVVVANARLIPIGPGAAGGAKAGGRPDPILEATRDAITLALTLTRVTTDVIIAITAMDAFYDDPGSGAKQQGSASEQGGGEGASGSGANGGVGSKADEDAPPGTLGRERFEAVVDVLRRVARLAGATNKGITFHFVPVSGLKGDNLIAPAPKAMPWAVPGPAAAAAAPPTAAAPSGPLLEVIGRVLMGLKEMFWSDTQAAMRMPLMDAWKVGGIGTVVSGRVASGVLRPGSKVCFAPYGDLTEVRSVESYHDALPHADAGTVAGVAVRVDQHKVKRGMVLCSTTNPLHPARSFASILKVVRMPAGKRGHAFRPGFTYTLHVHTAAVACRVVSITPINDAKPTNPPQSQAGADTSTSTSTSGSSQVFVKQPRAKLRRKARREAVPAAGGVCEVREGGGYLVEWEPCGPLAVESFDTHGALGSFVVSDKQTLVAVGRVKTIQTHPCYLPRSAWARLKPDTPTWRAKQQEAAKDRPAKPGRKTKPRATATAAAAAGGAAVVLNPSAAEFKVPDAAAAVEEPAAAAADDDDATAAGTDSTPPAADVAHAIAPDEVEAVGAEAVGAEAVGAEAIGAEAIGAEAHGEVQTDGAAASSEAAPT